MDLPDSLENGPIDQEYVKIPSKYMNFLSQRKMSVSLRMYCTDSTMVPESNVPNAYHCYQMSSQGKTLTTVKHKCYDFTIYAVYP